MMKPMAPQAEATARLEGFGAFVQQVMASWKVPGAAIGIVKDGQIIYQHGFGLRTVERNLPVTPQTLFAIGSCTKAFTALGLAILVDQGKLDWDIPVRTYLPAFKMYDPFASERMTPRDLLTHRSGLPAHDLVWYSSLRTREQLVARLPYLEPSKDFRTAWQYQNLMYMTAGYLAGVVAGQTWEEFTLARILQPLGMTHSNFSVTVSQQARDVALPYAEKNGEVREIPFRCSWLLLQLNNGTHNDQQIVSATQLAQTHTPQMVMPDAGRYPERPPLVSYALGWGVQPYRSHRMVLHGGRIDGFTACVALLPDDNIGVVVLNNLASSLPHIVAFNAIDRLLGLDEVPWNERLLKERDEERAASEKGKAQARADRVEGTHPSHPLPHYVGEYEHPAYGTLSVERDGNGLQATLNALSGPLQHVHYDIFAMNWEDWDSDIKVSFLTNVKGDINAVAALLEPQVKEIVFTRVPSKAMADPTFL